MKVEFYVNSGANIHSCNKSELMNVEELGYSEEEWNNLTEDEKWKEAEQWANEYLEIGYIEEEG